MFSEVVINCPPDEADDDERLISGRLNELSLMSVLFSRSLVISSAVNCSPGNSNSYEIAKPIRRKQRLIFIITIKRKN